ncbi:GNAT family N-acetyltransferase [uncultured Anaerococcus sp.]|uniref:GNAT family N-acetyltransferase n=1 Tax=uncultured Anaerococcus sp. TaxID=293428 RepID=UPI00261C5CC7|nr:GNAT family N-acetyltransferase [uncultured Anaerococcus sp.]
MNADFKINGKVIETDRLILRAFEQDDLDDFYEYTCVPGVGERAGWRHHKSKSESLKILDMFIKENRTFAICNKNNNKVIGSLGIEKYEQEDQLSELDDLCGRELGFALSKDYWNKGLMSEAIGAIINYLFNDLDFDFLTAGYFDFNSQSKRLQEKCGFRPYRKLIFETNMNSKEPGVLNLLLNPKKEIKINFPSPENLIFIDI